MLGLLDSFFIISFKVSTGKMSSSISAFEDLYENLRVRFDSYSVNRQYNDRVSFYHCDRSASIPLEWHSLEFGWDTMVAFAKFASAKVFADATNIAFGPMVDNPPAVYWLWMTKSGWLLRPNSY